MGKHDSDQRSLTNRKDKKENTSTSAGRSVGSLSDFIKSKIEYGEERAFQRWMLKFGPRFSKLPFMLRSKI
jgi:hypothetical protein